MKKLLILLTLAAATSVAMAYGSDAPDKITVDQLKTMLVDWQKAQKSDDDVALALKKVELTEQLTPTTRDAFTQYLPGTASNERLFALEAESAVLPPPAAEIPTTPAPDAATQQATLAKAQQYVTGVYAKLPDLTASREIARFQNVMIAGEANQSAMRDNVSQSAIPLYAQGSSTVRMVKLQKDVVESVGGVEKPPAEKDKTKWGANGIIISEGAVMALPELWSEISSSGNPHFTRWQLIDGKPVAVFAFSVDKKKSHYTVDYCCFPDAGRASSENFGMATGAPGLPGGKDNLSVQPEYKPYKTGGQFSGEIYIDPATGTVLRTTTLAKFRGGDYVRSENARTDYAASPVGGKTVVVEVRRISQAEIVPNGDFTPARVADRHNFVTEMYKDYAAK